MSVRGELGPVTKGCSMKDVFFFNDTATTEIYTLSLHDALPICRVGTVGNLRSRAHAAIMPRTAPDAKPRGGAPSRACARDRKSTRLNSSHANISYAVFCLKKKNNIYLAHISTLFFIILTLLPLL